jgi:hypothetical protein
MRSSILLFISLAISLVSAFVLPQSIQYNEVMPNHQRSPPVYMAKRTTHSRIKREQVIDVEDEDVDGEAITS